MQIEDLLRKTKDTVDIHQVFGEPYDRDGMTHVFQAIQNFRQAGGRQGKTTFTAAEHAMGVHHGITDVPGAVHDDGARQRIVVAGIESAEADRSAMAADIDIFGAVGARRRRV